MKSSLLNTHTGHSVLQIKATESRGLARDPADCRSLFLFLLFSTSVFFHLNPLIECLLL